MKIQNVIALLIVGLFSGICASLGIGGGFVLLLYLTAFIDIPQIQAQFINLCVFIPIAAISIFLHNKNKLIIKEILLKTIIFGIIGVVIGSFSVQFINGNLLTKLFAIFILIMGVVGLFSNKKNDNKL